MQQCCACRQNKDNVDFSPDKKGKNGLARICKACRKIRYRSKYGVKARVHAKEWRDNNKELKCQIDKKYRNNNQDKIKQHYWNNVDKKREGMRKRYHEAKSARQIYAQKFKKDNREYYTNLERIRLHKKKMLDCALSTEEIINIKNTFNNRCFKCGSIDRLAIDHFRPISKYYGLTIENALVLCIHCNSSKGNKDPEQFFTLEELRKLDSMGITGPTHVYLLIKETFVALYPDREIIMCIPSKKIIELFKDELQIEANEYERYIIKDVPMLSMIKEVTQYGC